MPPQLYDGLYLSELEDRKGDLSHSGGKSEKNLSRIGLKEISDIPIWDDHLWSGTSDL